MALPPGPRIPPVGQTLAWVARPEELMTKGRERYGDVFTVRLAAVGTLVFVADPERLKPIFNAHPQGVQAGGGTGGRGAGRATAARDPVMGRRSVLLLDGAEHLRARRLMLPPFHGERLATYEALIAEIAERAVESWPMNAPFRLQERMQAITLDVIARVVFGV